MPIHSCAYTFTELAATVLPAYMAQMRVALGQPIPMARFCRPGIGVKSILNEMALTKDFSGCYVLSDGTKPIYVGISRSVVSRLRQHVTGKTHFDASLAYKIAVSLHQDRAVSDLARAKAMDHPEFAVSFSRAQLYLQSLFVSFIAIKNPLELYLYEPFCAMELDTHQWNVFETH